jgi:hypothetical protein
MPSIAAICCADATSRIWPELPWQWTDDKRH